MKNMVKEDNRWLSMFNFGPLYIGVTDHVSLVNVIDFVVN